VDSPSSNASKIDWRPLAELLAAYDSFLITTHCRADCDALGSALGLAEVVESLGKRALVVSGDEIPEHIAFLDSERRVGTIGRTTPLEAVRTCDVMLVVDTSARGQLGPMATVLDAFHGPRAVIDHHVSSEDLGALVCKDETAEATGRLILELADYLGVAATPSLARNLFAAIATDTGWFRFSSVTEKTFAALARLVAAGASPPELFSQLFEQHSLARIHLRGRILSHVASECDGRLMWTYVAAEDFEATGAQPTDTEDAINALLTVAGAEVAALFVELAPQTVKASLRSRSDFDVRAVAEQFGGGGHRAAAGITLSCSRDEAQRQVLDALRAGIGK
jgi:phosphoesterase RecJ-like protein